MSHPETVPVEQADIDAARALLAETNGLSRATIANISEAFARYRIAHAPSEDAETVEVDVEDAPIELSLEEAYAWVSGYNAAIRAMQKEGRE